jgi:hypothetical protein
MPHSQVARQLGLAIAIRLIATYLPLLLLLVLYLLMIRPMQMMLALALMLLLVNFDVVAHAIVDDANADAKCRMLLAILMVPMLLC